VSRLGGLEDWWQEPGEQVVRLGASAATSTLSTCPSVAVFGTAAGSLKRELQPSCHALVRVVWELQGGAGRGRGPRHTVACDSSTPRSEKLIAATAAATLDFECAPEACALLFGERVQLRAARAK
jgi:hypothetical protein